MKNNRPILTCWPRLLDIHTSAAYLSVGEQTIRDWVCDGVIVPVAMPGSTLRDRKGRVVARPRDRRLVKILVERAELDALIDKQKRGAL